MTDKMERRRFLAKAAPAAALAVPLLSQGGRATSLEPSASQAGAKPKVKKIAVEEHCTFDETAAAAGRKSSGSRQADLGEVRLAAMDEAGVTMQVINNSDLQFITDASKAVEVAKRTNDRLAEGVSKHPDRLVAGFAGLPTQDPKAAIDEFERAVTKLGFKGAMVQGPDHANWEFLDSQKFWGLWERAAALGAPICIHPSALPVGSMKLLTEPPELGGLTWGGGVFCATQALRLMISGVFDAFPKATLILGHLGELLPYWLGRLDEHALGKTMKKKVTDYARENLLVSTSGDYHPAALVCAMSAMGADRVLFATDYPSGNGKEAVEFVEKTPISDADKEKIYHLNAERWLRL